MSEVVLDASALLAAIHGERGADRVGAALQLASICSVNLAEVVTKLVDAGMALDHARSLLSKLSLTVVPFDEDLAYASAELRATTKSLGLSLGDRACLALGRRLQARVFTADAAWAGIKDVDITIDVIR